MPRFQRYIGIDYSGEGVATASLTGLRVFDASEGSGPIERHSARPQRRRWDREILASWLRDELHLTSEPTIVGIDHAFSLTREWFDHFRLTTWDALLEQMKELWPPWVGVAKADAGRQAEAEREWRPWRLTDQWVAGAKSVFDREVRQGTVYYSTRAGLPWLHCLRGELGRSVHFWPFDGWDPRPGRSVIAEVYPTIFRRRYERDLPTGDQRDACAVCSWLQDRDQQDLLTGYFQPPLTSEEQERGRLEGWMLGVA